MVLQHKIPAGASFIDDSAAILFNLSKFYLVLALDVIGGVLRFTCQEKDQFLFRFSLQRFLKAGMVESIPWI